MRCHAVDLLERPLLTNFEIERFGASVISRSDRWLPWSPPQRACGKKACVKANAA